MPIPTSITDLSTTAASNSPAGSDSPTDGDNFIRALSAFIRQNYNSIEARALVSVTDAAYGAVGDGVTNDRAAIAAALAVGGRIRFPAGTYRVEFTTTDALTTIADTIIEGDGKDCTEIVFVPNSATYRNLITMGAANLTVRGVKISIEEAGSQTIAMFNVQYSGLTVEDCDLDGSITDDGASVSHTAYGFSYPESGTQDDFSLRRCKVHRFVRGFLKTNTSTSSQQRMSMVDNDFYDCYVASLTLNSPVGVCDAVLVSGNRFFFTGAITAGLTGSQYGHLALASVTNCSITGNYFSGVVDEGLHAEEACYGLTIANNTFDIDGDAIVVLDNNISGSALMPKWVSITGNVLRKSGTLRESGKHGIWLVFDATSEVPAKAVTIANNVVYGFDSGLYSDSEIGDGVSITDNVVDACSRGMHIASHCPQMRGNTTRGCTTDIYSSVAGWVENHSFVDPTTPVDATSIPVMLVDPSWSFSPQAITGGVTSYRSLIATGANDRVWGRLHYKVWTENVNDYAQEGYEILWDGTTFTATLSVTRQPGGLSVSAVQNSGNLALSLGHASNRTCRVTARLSGSVTVAV